MSPQSRCRPDTRRLATCHCRLYRGDTPKALPLGLACRTPRNSVVSANGPACFQSIARLRRNHRSIRKTHNRSFNPSLSVVLVSSCSARNCDTCDDTLRTRYPCSQDNLRASLCPACAPGGSYPDAYGEPRGSLPFRTCGIFLYPDSIASAAELPCSAP